MQAINLSGYQGITDISISTLCQVQNVNTVVLSRMFLICPGKICLQDEFVLKSHVLSIFQSNLSWTNQQFSITIFIVSKYGLDTVKS